MYLKEISLGEKIKCTCDLCDGSGIYHRIEDRKDIGIVCFSCNGRGYYTLESNYNYQLVEDEKTNVVYKVVDGLIDKHYNIFDKKKKINNINYVAYETIMFLSGSFLSDKHIDCLKSESFVEYEDFYNGKIPIPIKHCSCPNQLSNSYCDKEFNNNCEWGNILDCDKLHTDECWDMFYGNAKTNEEKKKVLMKL